MIRALIFWVLTCPLIINANPREFPIEEIGGFVFVRQVTGKPHTHEYLLLEKRGEWNFAKGHLEEGETYMDAAYREALEETGLKPEDFQLRDDLIHIKMDYVNSDNIRKLVELWPVKLIDPDHEVVLSDEHNAYTWAEYSVAADLVKKKWKEEVIDPVDAKLEENGLD